MGRPATGITPRRAFRLGEQTERQLTAIHERTGHDRTEIVRRLIVAEHDRPTLPPAPEKNPRKRR
jgi:hypothetical protein